MDLTQIRHKLSPYIDKAKELSSKAIQFGAKQGANTPLFLQSEEEYNIHVTAKRAIFLAYKEDEKNLEEVTLRLPLWTTLAWTDMADFKVLALTSNSSLGQTLGIQNSIEMRVFFEGNEYTRLTNLEDIKAWWKNRHYKKDEPKTDPLA